MINKDEVIKHCSQYSVMDAEKLYALYEEASACNSIPGIAIELGVYYGGSALLIRAALPSHRVLAIDSFDGLECPGKYDLQRMAPGMRGHSSGDFRISSMKRKSSVINLLQSNSVEIIPRPFSKDLIPDLPVAFAHCDADLYQPTLSFLDAVFPRLSPNGRLVIDDFDWPATPGVRRAIDDYFCERTERFFRINDTNQAIFVKGHPW